MKKIFIPIIAGLLISAASGGNVAVAQQDAACELSREKFAEISGAQNDLAPDSTGRIREELRVRKSLLREVVDCATKELSSLKSDFEKIKSGSQEARALQAQFSPWFSETLNYYALQKSAINDLGLQGSKDFARNVHAWRGGNFRPTSKTILQFAVWAQNQEFVQIAQNRLNQVKRAIDVFGLGINEEIREGSRAAEIELQKALALNRQAKEIIRTYGDSDEAGKATKYSLEFLASTYQKILELAEKINKAIVR